MTDSISSKDQLRAKSVDLFAQLRHQGHGYVADAFDNALAEIERLEQDNARFINSHEVLSLLLDTQRDRIKELEEANSQLMQDLLKGSIRIAEAEKRSAQPPNDALAHLQALTTAVEHMRVPQTMNDAALLIHITLGPVLQRAQEYLRAHSTKEGDGYGHCPECRAVPGTCVHSAGDLTEYFTGSPVTEDEAKSLRDRIAGETSVSYIPGAVCGRMDCARPVPVGNVFCTDHQ